MNALTVFMNALLVLVAATGLLVVLARNPRRQVFLTSLFGTELALLFFLWQAPDVAVAELAVGTLIVPALVLLTLARVEEGPK